MRLNLSIIKQFRKLYRINMGIDYFGALYALSVAAGGVVGYVKAGSTNSLVAGVAFGSLLAFGAYQTSVDEKNILLSFATSTVLGLIMGYRFFNTGKFMPAGLITVMSGLRMFFFVYKYALTPT
uniref:Transmembrane protein 14C n=1 Tax=Scytodes thoracica TaxID=1112478 RepID=A0A0A0V787_SCYTH|nr:hypothetical protein [Scytodes thoracica]